MCAHHLPVGRATALMGSLLGVGVSTGFMASVRARAARLLELAFMPRVGGAAGLGGGAARR